MVYVKTKSLWEKKTIAVFYNVKKKVLFCSSNPIQKIPSGYKKRTYVLPFKIHPTPKVKTGWVKRRRTLLWTYYSEYTININPIREWEVNDGNK